MDKNTDSIVAVANHQNESDAKRIRLDEAHQKYPYSNTVCRSSKNSIFAGLCKESSAKICDEKNMQTFKIFPKQNACMLLIKI